MIDEKIRRKLKLTAEQVPYSMMYYGNTSSCTIPVTMVTQIREKLVAGENVEISVPEVMKKKSGRKTNQKYWLLYVIFDNTEPEK
jgi:hypothetical protein